jgi:predicted HD superfamily hydrolase involved in NAD metabolism
MTIIVELIRKNSNIVQKMARTLSPERFRHTIQVALMAGELAIAHDQNVGKVIKAALIHDYAREKNDEELLALAEKSGWEIDPVERNQPMLLHGPVAAFLAWQEWGIKDPVILEAITYHTTGKAQMTPTTKILYIADMVESGRVFPC